MPGLNTVMTDMILTAKHSVGSVVRGSSTDVEQSPMHLDVPSSADVHDAGQQCL